MKTKTISGLQGVVILCGAMVHCSSAQAEMGVSGSMGYGVARIRLLRLGIQKTFNQHWWTEKSWVVGGYWEGSVYTMHTDKQSPIGSRHKQLNAIVAAGVFRFERAEKIRMGWPYVELGVGLSRLSQKEIGGRKLGMPFQFEDRIGIGIRFGEKHEFDIGYKAIHFSNAYIGSWNHGINLHLLTLGFWFQ